MSTTHDIDQEDIDLNFVRNKHYDVIRGLSDDKTGAPPTDPETLTHYLATLREMNKVSLTKKRIKSDEKIAAGNTANVQLAAQILASIRPVQPPLPHEKRTVELVKEVLPPPILLPGELDKTGKGENYNTFMQRTKELPKND